MDFIRLLPVTLAIKKVITNIGATRISLPAVVLIVLFLNIRQAKINTTSANIKRKGHLKTSSILDVMSPRNAAEASKPTERYLLKKLEYITLQNIKNDIPAKIPAGIHLLLKDAKNKNIKTQLTKKVGIKFAVIPIK